jgi:GDP-mannose 6-dehydrogenase
LNISVFGLGYAGSIALACLARLGHRVIGLDPNPQKRAQVRQGKPPVNEPGLSDLFAEGCAAGRISVSDDVMRAVAATDLSFVCVGTPALADGNLDDSQLRQVIQSLAAACLAKTTRHLIVVRSTALPATHQALMARLTSAGLPIDRAVGYVVHPEFLREGNGIEDFFAPPLLIFGGAAAEDRRLLEQLYPEMATAAHFVNRDTAAAAKYADNLFHAAKITFANEIGRFSRSLGVDGRDVMALVTSNTRFNLSAAYLAPGLPFGGSCLPKDLSALLQHAAYTGLALPLFSAIQQSNRCQMEELTGRLTALHAHRFLLIGLAFKAETDDLRGSPLLQLAQNLVASGKSVRIFAPELAPERLGAAGQVSAAGDLPDLAARLADTLEAALADTDIVLLGRPLTAAQWQLVEASEAQIIDLAGAAKPGAAAQRYHGLYW